VLELLRRGLGVSSEDEAPNGLRALAGSWSKEDLRAFESATAVFEQVDEELWE
jgi:hypothetical protein